MVNFSGVLVALCPKPTPTLFPPASENEILIIIASFSGELKNAEIFPERYVRDYLSERIERLKLSGHSARLEIWTEPIKTQREARELGQIYNATLVIWGEFDDIGGLRTFVEIMKEVPQRDIQQSGNLLPLFAISSGEKQDNEVSKISRDCLLKGAPEQADYLATVSLGIVHLIQGEQNLAEEFFTQSIDVVHSDGHCQESIYQAYYWQGVTHSFQEYYLEALEDLNKALELDSEFRPALFQRGLVRLAIGDGKAAQSDFEVALKLTYPEDRVSLAALYGNIGVALEMQGEFDQALGYYEKSWFIHKDIDNKKAQVLNLTQLGSLHYHQKNYDAALDHYLRALDLCRSERFRQEESIVLGNIGLVWKKKGTFEKSLALFEESLAISQDIEYNSGQGRQLIRIGAVYLQRGKAEKALQAFNQAFEIYENIGSVVGQANAKVGIGGVEYKCDNKEKALLVWQEALQLYESVNSPESARVRELIEATQP
jgi:tetratricopeptide (TPR) repeat protein